MLSIGIGKRKLNLQVVLVVASVIATSSMLGSMFCLFYVVPRFSGRPNVMLGLLSMSGIIGAVSFIAMVISITLLVCTTNMIQNVQAEEVTEDISDNESEALIESSKYFESPMRLELRSSMHEFNFLNEGYTAELAPFLQDLQMQYSGPDEIGSDPEILNAVDGLYNELASYYKKYESSNKSFFEFLLLLSCHLARFSTADHTRSPKIDQRLELCLNQLYELMNPMKCITTSQAILLRVLLLSACQNNHISVVEFFCSSGLELDFRFFLEFSNAFDAMDQVRCMYFTPLMCAIYYGHEEMVQKLIEKNVEFNRPNPLPLLYAVQNGKWNIVKILIENGADIDATEQDQIPVFYLAAENNQLEIMKMLLELKVNFDCFFSRSCFLLHAVASSGSIEMMDYYCSDILPIVSKECFNVVDRHNKTALHLAAEAFIECPEKDFDAIISTLIANGACNDRIDNRGCLPLHYAVAVDNPRILESVKLLTSVNFVNAQNGGGNTALHCCMSNKNSNVVLDIVHHLEKNDANFNIVNNDGQTALHLAVKHNHLSVVDCLKGKLGARVIDTSGNNLMHCAAFYGRIDMVKQFLHDDDNRNFYIGDRNDNGETPLHRVLKSLLKTDKSLLKTDKSPLKTNKSQLKTNKLLKIVALLIDNGVDISAVDKSGFTALKLADKLQDHKLKSTVIGCIMSAKKNNICFNPVVGISNQFSDLIILLNILTVEDLNAKLPLLGKEVSSCVNSEGKNLLHCICDFKSRAEDVDRRKAIICFLLDQGVDVNAVDHKGNNALHYAAVHANKEIILLLLEKGIDCMCANKRGEIPLHHLIQAIGSLDEPYEETDILDLLIDKMNDIQYVDESGCTILHYLTPLFSCDAESSSVLPKVYIEQLLTFMQSKSFQFNSINKMGETVLHRVSKMSTQEDFLKMLLGLLNKEGINLRDFNGNTALHYAAMNGYSLDIFIEKGADVTLFNNEHQTALHAALKKDNDDVVEILIGHSVDVLDVCDGDGYNALHYAIARNHRDSVIKMLLDHGAAVNIYNPTGKTALHLAVERYDLDRLKTFMSYLDNAKCDFNIRDAFGKLPLLYAIDKCNVNKVQMLIERTDLTIADYNGRTPLQYVQNLIDNNQDKKSDYGKILHLIQDASKDIVPESVQADSVGCKIRQEQSDKLCSLLAPDSTLLQPKVALNQALPMVQ